MESDQKLLFQIRHVHERSRETYGYLKTWKTLKAQGILCGKHRIARLRRIHGIESKRRRRFKITTRSRDCRSFTAPNRLNRCFTAERPNQVWVGDITAIPTRLGWLYLAVLLDLYSRKIIGWSMSERLDKRLVLDTLDMALLRRKPKSEVLHHTDQGAVYTADEYREKLSDYRLTASMSRRANCYDNAVAESFFSTLKNELLWGRSFLSRDQARSEIFEYMEVFYNRQRIHQSLNYLTPEKMELSVVP